MRCYQKKLCIIGVPEEKERGKGVEGLFKEIMAENFPNLGRDLNAKFIKLIGYPKISTQNPGHIIVK